MVNKIILTERELEEIIKQTVKNVLNEENGNIPNINNSSIRIVEYTPNTPDWEYIAKNKKDIWEFLNNGYTYAGYERFCGCDNPRSLFKNAVLIKIAFEDNDWIAISIYTGYRDGYKNVGITATTNKELRKHGVDAVKNIIKSDIKNYDLYFWTECSGTIDVLYEKYNGIKIPNEYAFGILQKEITPDSDGFHYTRLIKGEEQRKIIYGFNNAQTFEKVKAEREEYINNCVREITSMQINETEEKPSFGHLSRIDTSIAVVNFFVDQRWEDECYEFPESSLSILKKHIQMLSEYIANHHVPADKLKTIQQVIENGRDIIETSSVMELFRL